MWILRGALVAMGVLLMMINNLRGAIVATRKVYCVNSKVLRNQVMLPLAAALVLTSPHGRTFTASFELGPCPDGRKNREPRNPRPTAMTVSHQV